MRMGIELTLMSKPIIKWTSYKLQGCISAICSDNIIEFF
jgi:hypothetical protein